MIATRKFLAFLTSFSVLCACASLIPHSVVTQTGVQTSPDEIRGTGVCFLPNKKTCMPGMMMSCEMLTCHFDMQSTGKCETCQASTGPAPEKIWAGDLAFIGGEYNADPSLGGLLWGFNGPGNIPPAPNKVCSREIVCAMGNGSCAKNAALVWMCKKDLLDNSVSNNRVKHVTMVGLLGECWSWPF